MPVFKFKSAADMPTPVHTDDARLLERIRTLWNRAFELTPPEFNRGVARFRSMEEANEARADVVARRMRRIAESGDHPR